MTIGLVIGRTLRINLLTNQILQRIEIPLVTFQTVRSIASRLAVRILVINDHTTRLLSQPIIANIIPRIAHLTHSSLNIILITIQINTPTRGSLVQIHPGHTLQTSPIYINL